MTTAILHAVFAAAVVGAYTALTITGHDGTALLGLLAGQGAGATIASTAGSIVRTVEVPVDATTTQPVA